MRSRKRLALTAAVFSSACACSGGGTSDDYSIEGALAELPASVGSDAQLIQTADLDGATELSGLKRPTDLDPEAVSDWILPLVGVQSPDGSPAPVFVPVPDVVNPRELTRIDEFDEELGWSLLDVESLVEQSTPPETFAVVTRAFDSDQLNPDLAQASDAVVSAGEGGDFQTDLDGASAARPLGIPLRMSQDGGRIAASPSTPFVEDWAAGPDETLADDESLASVAAALDDADAVSAVLTSGRPLGGVAMLAPEQLSTLADQLPTDPFDTVGIGWGVDDEGAAAITVAYHFAAEETATDNVETIAQVYSDGTSLQTGEPISERVTLGDASAEGQVVVVTLSLSTDSTPAVVFDMLQVPDLPFLHQ